MPQPTREHMRNDVTAYMRYYNLERLHTANGDLSPVEYEQHSLRKVSGFSCAEHSAVTERIKKLERNGQIRGY